MSEHHYITSADGLRLAYRVWKPTTPLRAAVAVVHGWNDHSGRYTNLANALVPEGMSVYGIDLRGHGESDGKRGHIESWADYRADVMAFLEMVRGQAPKDTPLFLFGHSGGGLVTMDYLIHHPDIELAGVVLSAPFVAPANVPAFIPPLLRLLARVAPRVSINPGADSKTLSRDLAVVAAYDNDPFNHSRTTPRYGVELEQTQAFVLSNLDALQHPLLLVYGGADGLVPPDMSRKMFDKMGAVDKTRYEYDGGYHELINDICKDEVLQDIKQWLNAHIA